MCHTSVLQFLKIGSKEIEITACWANQYAPGAVHRAHSHPDNYLSAVYYVRAWPGANAINFYDPRSQTGIIRKRSFNPAPFTSGSIVMGARSPC